MDITTIGTVTAIVAICYLFGLAAKAISAIPDNWIPVIVGTCGGLLGVACLYVMPEFPANDVVTAIAIGIVSGLASTGVNQVYKQIAVKGKEEEPPEDLG